MAGQARYASVVLPVYIVRGHLLQRLPNDTRISLFSVSAVDLLLPFLEQPGLEAVLQRGYSGDFWQATGINRPECMAAMATTLRVLQCPSDGSAGSTSTNQYQRPDQPVAVTNYKGVIGDAQIGGALSQHPGTLPDCHSTGRCNGLFFRTTILEPQALRNVRDGTSNTFLIGEDIPAENYHSAAFYATAASERLVGRDGISQPAPLGSPFCPGRRLHSCHLGNDRSQIVSQCEYKGRW